METSDILKELKEKEPLIHCITNPISMTQCANTVLALGAKPIMAEHPAEVCEITASAKALLLNLGNISDIRIEAMVKAYETATAEGIPVVIDAVGTACSSLRRKFALRLLEDRENRGEDSIKQGQVLVVKGNYSEIIALNDESYKGKGVDADRNLTPKEVIQAASKIAENYGIVILATGEIDIVTDGNSVFYIKNGTGVMGAITGTGCMLGALVATFLAGDSAKGSKTCALSAAAFGIAGELAEDNLFSEKGKVGSGSFFVSLLDEISFLTDEKIQERMKVYCEK